MADGMLPMLGLSSADGNQVVILVSSHRSSYSHVVYTPADGNNLVGFDSDPARESVQNHLLDPIGIQKYTRPLQGGLSGSDPLADFHNPPLAGLGRPGPIGDQSSQNGDSLRIPVFDPKRSLIGPHHGPTLNLSRLGLHHDQSCTSRDAKTTGVVPVPGHVSQRPTRLVTADASHILGPMSLLDKHRPRKEEYHDRITAEAPIAVLDLSSQSHEYSLPQNQYTFDESSDNHFPSHGHYTPSASVPTRPTRSPSRPQQPYNITSPFGIQQSFRPEISSYSSLSGWNGVSNSTATRSSSTPTSSINLGSIVHATAPAFTSQGRLDSLTSGSGYRHEILREHWPPASIRVDEMHKSVLANPQNFRDPELLAGSDSLPGHRQGSNNNQRAGEYSSTEFTSHLSAMSPVFPPKKEKALNHNGPKQSQIHSKAARSFDSSKFLSALLDDPKPDDNQLSIRDQTFENSRKN
ncbi:hypothetical protein BU17DRAFT_88170 [Hysterangium stoloniferum]|nr:hypothetical protein BU17DRAFT_88170 [Hysterangium stoloniferum]